MRIVWSRRLRRARRSSTDGELRCGGPRAGLARRVEALPQAARARDHVARSRRVCRRGRRRRATRSASAMPARAGAAARRSGRIRCSWRLILAPPDVPPLRRRARGRAPRAPRPRAAIQGARGAAVRTRAWPRRRRRYAASGRGCDGSAGAERIAAGAAAAGAAAAAAGAVACWRLLLRREGLVELLLASARRCRRGGPSAAAADSPGRAAARRSAFRSRRPSAPSPFASIAVSPYISSSGVSCQSGIGTCVSNCSTGRLATATVMKSWKARAGAVPPCRPATGAHRRGPSTRRSSARSRSR